MRITILIFFVLACFNGNTQSCYSGFLGKYPITLIAYHYSDDDFRAYYVYDKFDTPIIINGSMKGKGLELLERDEKGNVQAILSFPNFEAEAESITGTWTNKDGRKKYDIRLEKDFDLENEVRKEWEKIELLQSGSTENHYFKTLLTKNQADFSGRISGVKIFEKRTDNLLQTIELNCELFGIDHVSIGDYNFDGIEDFSVFESTYAGPNTSSIYLLREPNTEKYFVSEFSGTSLEFDQDTKLIYEHNQCCAGRSHVNATYKVVNNKMVLLEKKCLEYDDEKEDFIEVKCQ